ncbi:MAG: ABC transporter permease [Methylococcales bacterium]|nr:ABC transporter permease [Methylococcales bacterium]
MIDSLYLAWRYIVFNRKKTITLITCISLITFLPFALKALLSESEHQLMSRAATTPLLVGAKGNSLDLVMNSLYFSKEEPDFITMKSADEIIDSGLALPIPLYTRFQAREYPIVGTSLDYFEFRHYKIEQGRAFAMLGECLIGADVASKLNLSIGDSILSSPENLFDLAGIYPLKMVITGVLEKTNSADDKAVFVDLKTAWVIQGLGHGHQDVKKMEEAGAIVNQSKNLVTASSKVKQYTEINTDNLESFHFHGDPSIYPLTAIITIPQDDKSATILRGRYLSDQQDQQIVRPKEVIEDLLGNIFRIKDFIDGVVLVVAIAMILAVMLVFSLSLRLRQKEINTIFHLGCSRATVVQLIAAEILIIVLASGILCYLSLLVLQHYQENIVHTLFIS